MTLALKGSQRGIPRVTLSLTARGMEKLPDELVNVAGLYLLEMCLVTQCSRVANVVDLGVTLSLTAYHGEPSC